MYPDLSTAIRIVFILARPVSRLDFSDIVYVVKINCAGISGKDGKDHMTQTSGTLPTTSRQIPIKVQ